MSPGTAPRHERMREGLLRQTLTGMSHRRSDGLVIAVTSADPHAGVGFLTGSLAEELGVENRGSVYCMSSAVLQDACEQAQDVDSRTLVELERAVFYAQTGSKQAERPVWRDNRTFCSLILNRLRAEYQYIFVACPALVKAQDVLSVAPLVDGIIIVVEANRTESRQIQVLERTLEAVGGTIAGYVLNKRSYAIPQWLYSRLSGAGL